MKLIFTDETNQQPDGKTEFFIYGGCVIDCDDLADIGEKISKIKADNNIPKDERLKFSYSKKSSFTYAEHKAAKEQLIDLCVDNKVVCIVCVALHKIAKNGDPKNLQKMCSNTVFDKYDTYLMRKSDQGAVIVDNWPHDDVYSHLESSLNTGVHYENGTVNKLSNVLFYAQSGIRVCEFNSIVDVMIGGLRYVINNRDKTDAPKAMLPKIVKCLWGAENAKKDGHYPVIDAGFNLSPREVGHPPYKEKYEDLINHLNKILG
ncbi:DUF3800 domain-containing protein [Pontiellaceae bacterium B12219]|nr:DUF3800 domain-containing protein [Pontiellaceae bacterium B12219]